MTPSHSDVISPKAAREQMSATFNDEDLRDICFDLLVDYDALAGTNKSGKVRELIAATQRTGRYSELIKHIANLRPNLTWYAQSTDSGPIDVDSIVEFVVDGIPIKGEPNLKRDVTGTQHVGFIIAVHNIANQSLVSLPFRLALELDYSLVPNSIRFASVVNTGKSVICNLFTMGGLFPDEWSSAYVDFTVTRDKAWEQESTRVCSMRLIAYTQRSPKIMPFTLTIDEDRSSLIAFL